MARGVKNCDTSLKRVRHGHRTMVKEKVFCTGGLDHGWFVSTFTVGSNQKVLEVLGSSVCCHRFSVEERKSGVNFLERPVIVCNLFQIVILGVVIGEQDRQVCALRMSARGWMEKLVSVHPSGFDGRIPEEVYGVPSVQEVYSHVFHVCQNLRVYYRCVSP